jgi:CubicO group peptidase (beta-lactamase class C family)
MQKIQHVILAGLAAILFTYAAADNTTFSYPATSAGTIAREFFETLNSDDPGRISNFILSYRSTTSLAKRPIDERVAKMMQIHKQVGVLTPALVSDETERSLTVSVRSEQLGIWLSVRFDLDEDEPDKLSVMSMQPTSPPNPGVSEELAWSDLSNLLEQLRSRTGIPAIAVAIVEDGRIVEQAVSGVRQVDTENAVARNDGFHIGSVTKSMTATAVGRLVEQGQLDWDDTIGEVLMDMDIREEYRNVTVEQLLQHRSGLDGYLNFDDAEMERLVNLPGTPTEQRAAFVAEVLLSDPIAPAGKGMNYSNAGYTVAGLMAERASGRSWEELVSMYVLEPAGTKHSGFGWPATETSPDQPRGHFREGDGFRAQGLDEYPLGYYLAPAGNVFCSIGDMALYARMHLAGLNGSDGVLKAGTIERLHTPLDNVDAGQSASGNSSYACGWAIVESPENGLMHSHSGSAGTFFASIELYPRENRAIVIAMNVGLEGVAACETISKLVNERWKSAPRN